MYLGKIIHFLKSQNNSAVLVKGTSVSLLLRVAGAGIVFILHIILARLLGIENYGYYVYASSWIALLVYFSKLGTDTSIIKFVPDYQVHERWGMIQGLFIRSRQLVLGLSLCIIFIAVFIIYFNRDIIGHEQSTVLLIALGTIPLFGLMSLYTSMLRVFKHVFKALAPGSTIWPLTLMVLTVIYFQIKKQPLSANEVMGLNLVALFVAVCISCNWAIKAIPVYVKKTHPQFHERQWFRTSLPLFLITGFNIILSRADTIMIGIFSDERQVAFYSVASRISDLVLFGMTAAATIVAPLIAQLYAQKNMLELQKIITLAAWGISLFTTLSGIFLLTFGKYILSLFGESFIASHSPFLILLAAYGIKGFIGPVIPLMMMTRYQKQLAIITSFSVVFNIVLNLFLIPQYGATGAAIATMATITFSYLIMLIYILKNLKINPTPFTKLTVS